MKRYRCLFLSLFLLLGFVPLSIKADTFKLRDNGYKFIGYYSSIDDGILLEYYNEVGIDNDMIFCAKWEKIITDIDVVKNPKTFDGIGSSIFMLVVSLIFLLVIIICLKRKK